MFLQQTVHRAFLPTHLGTLILAALVEQCHQSWPVQSIRQQLPSTSLLCYGSKSIKCSLPRSFHRTRLLLERNYTDLASLSLELDLQVSLLQHTASVMASMFTSSRQALGSILEASGPRYLLKLFGCSAEQCADFLKVNNTSGLQIHSVMYRFFPTVFWSKGYPNRKEIVEQIEKVWKTYNLQDKTTFNYKVESVREDDKGRWIINGNSDEKFDGIIAAIGSCGDPKVPHVPGREKFKGQIYHSSELDGKDVKDKTVLIIGGGASAIEAMEFTTKEKAKKAKILSRSEKWIIPRNPVIDMLLSFNILGQETMFSWIPERLLRKFFYRDLADISPPPGSAGLFEETPMVNNDVLEQIRSGNAEWLRGDILEVEENGIRFNRRQQGVPKNGPGHETVEEGEVIIMATGYKRPSLSFLPEECFAEPYSAPNWYVFFSISTLIIRLLTSTL